MYNQTNTQIDFTYPITELFNAVQQQSAYVARNMSAAAENGNPFDIYCITADEADFFRMALNEAVNSLFSHYITQTETIVDSVFVSRNLGTPPVECCGFSIRRNALDGVSLYNTNRLPIIDLSNAEYLRNFILLRWYQTNAVTAMAGMFNTALELDLAKIGSNNFELKKRYYGSARAQKPPVYKHKCVIITSLEEYESISDKRNDTLYACLDEAEGGITKAFVGVYPFLISQPAKKQYTIEISVNPTDVSRIDTIVAEGDVVDSNVSEAKDVYSFTVHDGGSVTIQIKPKDGCRVQKLNIDTVSQGAVDTYVFKEVNKNHTAYVWMEVIEEIPVDYLIRNDKPDVLYSSTHVILKSIKADYPDGLTKDVTVICVKKAKEPRLSIDPNKLRNELAFISVLKDWNQGSLYSLTIDGMNLLTYSCRSLGGLRFTNVDNVVVKNVNFINFGNLVDEYKPNETAALMLVGHDSNYCRNFLVENCKFNGISTSNGKTGATFTISTKYTENVTISNSTFTGNSGLTFRMSNSTLTVFSKNSISGNYIEGVVSHPGIFDISSGHLLIIEDNLIDSSSFRENTLYVNNVNDIRIRRNTFKKGARVVEFLADSKISHVEIDSNLFEGMIEKPIYDWIKAHFSGSTTIDELIVRNNTFWLSGNYYQKFVLKMLDVGKLFFYNNIVVDPRSDVSASIMEFTTLEQCYSGNNLYKVKIINESTGQTGSILFSVLNPDNLPSSLTVNGSDQRSLSLLQDKGYETDTALVLKSKKLLSVENGGTDYSITSEYDSMYPANNDHLPPMDNLYRQSSATQANSRGYINLHGIAVDESATDEGGYEGYNVEENGQFSHQEQHATPADSTLLLTYNTMNRSHLARWMVRGTQHNDLLLGNYVMMHTKAEIDNNGEYVADELYTIDID